ncbi:T-cell leukemia/lymphoma protein 1A [Muntiacus reevesi]|uniref:T-cell leukemia/lymphoma protein 1A n=1 Tax=Muntiacus reevesi TaxID=9886 RepID=UPI0033072E2A
MAEGPFFRAQTPLHPDHLWIWEKAVYVDENRRTWLPITIEVQPLSLQVLLRQEDVPLGDPVCPSQLGPYLLPVMWQLYPGRRYRASDSSFWRIVYHIEIGGTEDMLLEQLPDPEDE